MVYGYFACASQNRRFSVLSKGVLGLGLIILGLMMVYLYYDFASRSKRCWYIF
jgi:hypothetical protein